MTAPIAPDDTAGLAILETIVGKAVKNILPKTVTTRAELIGYTAIAAYLEAIGGVVVSTDDLRAVLEMAGDCRHPLPGEQEAYDRLDAKAGEGT